MSQFAHPQCSAPAEPAPDSPFQKVEEGIKAGEIVVIAAGNGVGKSQLFDDAEPQHCTDYLNDRT